MNNFSILNNFDTCPNCGNIFVPLNSNMKFCTSEKCKQEVSDEDVFKRLDELKKLGVDKKASIEITSQELKVNKNYIKDLVIKASEKLK